MKNPLLLLLVLLPLTATADDLRPLRDAPPAFQTECGSCHVAFPPQLLAADDWRRVMRSLDKHYGDNASLDEKTRNILEAFHVRNAGHVRSHSPARSGDALPRLTQTAWFIREHRKVPTAVWTHAKVKTAANCVACHSQAATGSYLERELTMPVGKKAGQRWED